jgi:DNA-binding response OmpR family regulator
MSSVGHRKVLIVEDEYFLASDLETAVEDRGWEVVGPAATVGAAFDLLNANTISDAILVINLGGEMVFNLADELVRRSIPFVFATGYEQDSVPERFADAPRCTKPCEASSVLALLP